MAHFSPHPERDPRISAIRAANVLLCRCYHRVTVHTPCRLPKTGPGILICNHTSGLDPFMLQTLSSRVLVWMMAREYYEIPLFKPMFKLVEAIPVDRASRDTSAVRLAFRALQDGRLVGIFPEGRICMERGKLHPFQPGVATLAIKTGAPVFPAFIEGSQYGITDMSKAFMHRQQASVRFGPQVQFDRSSTSKEAVQEATAKLQQAIESLRG